MERDFMGLNPNDSVVVVKEEVDEGGCKDSGSARSSGFPWPLSNKSCPEWFFSIFFMAYPSLENHFVGVGQNFEGGTMKQQFFGGSPHSILPSTAGVAGTTEQWINSFASDFAAQLTIFYDGTAEAIMFLAGNYVNMAPCSPMSVSSHPIDQSANTEDVKVSMTIVNKVEPQRMVSSLGSVAATAIISSAVPQARKASLARFLEKRKERAMHASPYKLGKKAADCATTDSNDFGLSATS
ncbi:hypothetical protein DH2020_046276 [Rehmannia glutinosa]|uniref:Uncharacterized protein n=1 Tax=Rehmannia glutinosa TaxID=99300 RepID=A0ABR0UCI5_REHGL